MPDTYETIFMRATATKTRRDKIHLEATGDGGAVIMLSADGEVVTVPLHRGDLIELHHALGLELEDRAEPDATPEET